MSTGPFNFGLMWIRSAFSAAIDAPISPRLIAFLACTMSLSNIRFPIRYHFFVFGSIFQPVRFCYAQNLSKHTDNTTWFLLSHYFFLFVKILKWLGIIPNNRHSIEIFPISKPNNCSTKKRRGQPHQKETLIVTEGRTKNTVFLIGVNSTSILYKINIFFPTKFLWQVFLFG